MTKNKRKTDTKQNENIAVRYQEKVRKEVHSNVNGSGDESTKFREFLYPSLLSW